MAQNYDGGKIVYVGRKALPGKLQALALLRAEHSLGKYDKILITRVCLDDHK